MPSKQQVHLFLSEQDGPTRSLEANKIFVCCGTVSLMILEENY